MMAWAYTYITNTITVALKCDALLWDYSYMGAGKKNAVTLSLPHC